MAHQSNYWRPATYLLLAILLTEVGLLYLLCRQGWFASGNRFRFAVLSLFVITAFLGLAICFVRCRYRIGIWQLLLALTFLSAFCAWSVKPLYEFRADRVGSLQLIAAGGSLTASSHYFSSNSHSQITNWLEVFVESSKKVPRDDSVTCVVLHNDEQLQLLVQHAQRFPALKSITLYQVSPIALSRLALVLPHFADLAEVWSQNVVFPEAWFRGLNNLQTVSINWWPPSTVAAVAPTDIADLAAMPKLQRFTAFGIAFNDDHAEALGRSSSLKEVVLHATNITSVGIKALKRGSDSRGVVVQGR